MNSLGFKRFLSFIIMFGQFALPNYSGAAISDALNGNLLAPDQNTYGKWTPDKWIKAGWSGYHVIAETVQANRTVSYTRGSGDSKTTHWIRNAQGGSDLCPDGDCRYSKKAYIYQIGNGAFKGKKVPGEGYIGGFIARDSGSVESTAVVAVDNTYIARFDETEAQQQNAVTNMRFSEGQVTTLSGFDSTGAQVPRGHIEEADAPWQINQTESYYKNTVEGPKFITTVVEKIYTSTEDGKEGTRGGTFWCNSDDFKLTTDSWKRFFKNDDFDMAQCRISPGEITSDGTNEVLQAIQGGESRVNSDVTLNTSNNEVFKYRSESDKCGIGGFSFDCNGTQYFIDAYHKKGHKIRPVHVNSDRLKWSMTTTSEDHFGYYENFPNAKFITLNYRNNPGFIGIDDYDDWIHNPNGYGLALLIHDKTDEMLAANLDGDVCGYDDDEFDGGYKFGGKVEITDTKEIAQTCKMFTKYTLHYYIMFPKKVAGKEMDTYEKMAILDRVLAAMPDQAQPSKELHAAEEFGDAIQILARYNATGNPSQATNFDILVDLATEEDSTSAGRKAEDLFFDLGFIKKERVGRVPDVLPEPVEGISAAPEIGDPDDDF